MDLGKSLSVTNTNRCLCCYKYSNTRHEYLPDNVFDLITKCFSIQVPNDTSGTVCQSCFDRLLDSQQFKDLILDTLSKLNSVQPDNIKVELSEENHQTHKHINDPEEYHFQNNVLWNSTPDSFGVCKSEPVQTVQVSYIESDSENTIDDANDDGFLGDKYPKRIRTEIVDITNQNINWNQLIHKELRVSLVKLEYLNSVAFGESISDKPTKTAVSYLDKSSSIKWFTCKHCDKWFKSKDNLMEHLKHEHPKISTSKSTKAYLRNVMTKKRVVENNKDTKSYDKHQKYRYKCKLCFKEMKSVSGFHIHMAAAHSDEQKFMCDICSKGFKFMNSLRRHLFFHSDVRNYKCDSCPKAFKTKLGLIRHKNCHNDERRYLCDNCNKAFKCPISLRYHQAVHSVEPNFKCGFCSEAFVTVNEIKSHMFAHSDQIKLKCNICSEFFKSVRKLRSHMIDHSNIGNLKCDFCSKTFKSNNILKIHKIRSHRKQTKQ